MRRGKAWGCHADLHYGCIMPIPLQLQKKSCLMQRSRGFGHGVVICKNCYSIYIYTLIVLLMWLLQTKLLVEAGLPAFQLPMFAKWLQNVTHCRKKSKRDLCDMFVSGIYSRHSFLQRHSAHEEIRESVVGSWIIKLGVTIHTKVKGFPTVFSPLWPAAKIHSPQRARDWFLTPFPSPLKFPLQNGRSRDP